MTSSPFLDALLARIRSGRPFESAVAAALLQKPLAHDLRALVEAKARFRHGFIGFGDLWMEDGDLARIVEAPGGGARTDVLVIGQTGGGDLYIVPRDGGGSTSNVSIVSRDFGWEPQEHAYSLDDLIEQHVREEREDGEPLADFPPT